MINEEKMKGPQETILGHSCAKLNRNKFSPKWDSNYDLSIMTIILVFILFCPEPACPGHPGLVIGGAVGESRGLDGDRDWGSLQTPVFTVSKHLWHHEVSPRVYVRQTLPSLSSSVPASLTGWSWQSVWSESRGQRRLLLLPSEGKGNWWFTREVTCLTHLRWCCVEGRKFLV